MNDNVRTVGRVEFFNNIKGWGIIKDEHGDSVFIHHNEIKDKRFYPETGPDKFRTLEKGFYVTFTKLPPMNKEKSYPIATNLKIGVAGLESLNKIINRRDRESRHQLGRDR